MSTRSRAIFLVKVDTIDLRSGRRQSFEEITPPDLQAFGGIESVLVTPPRFARHPGP
jgi:hypothetical protein